MFYSKLNNDYTKCKREGWVHFEQGFFDKKLLLKKDSGTGKRGVYVLKISYMRPRMTPH